MNDHDERIRQRAHEIWEEEGRPEGREYSHWLRARAEILAAEDESRAKTDRPSDFLGLGFRLIQPA
jgi:hypothetical protein